MGIIDLLKIEYRKFNKSAVIRLLILIFAILFPLIIFALKKAIPSSENSSLPFSTDIFYEFPTVWDYQGYIGSWLIFVFLSFLAVHIFCAEVANKTLRQSIINGMTRQQFFLSKLLTILVICTIATLLYFITGAAIGLGHTPNPSFEKVFSQNWATLRFFLSCLGHLSLAFLFAVWIRRAGIALFVFLGYSIIEPAIRWGFYWQVYKTKAILFFPLNAFEDLMPFPPYKLGEAIPDNIDFPLLLTTSEAMISSIIFIVLILFVAYKSFMKKDI